MKIHKSRCFGRIIAIALAILMVFGSAASQTMAVDGSFGNVITASAETVSGDYCTYNKETKVLTINNNNFTKGEYLLNGFESDDQNEIKSNAVSINANSTIVLSGKEQCDKLFKLFTNVENIDLTNVDLSGVIFTNSMFHSCYKLTNITFGNCPTGLNRARYMFYDCDSLKEIDLSSFQCENNKITRDLTGMFQSCNALETVDVSSLFLNYYHQSGGYDLFIKTDLFRGCNNLKRITIPKTYYNSTKNSVIGGKNVLADNINLQGAYWYSETNPRESVVTGKESGVTIPAGTYVKLDQNYTYHDVENPSCVSMYVKAAYWTGDDGKNYSDIINGTEISNEELNSTYLGKGDHDLNLSIRWSRKSDTFELNGDNELGYTAQIKVNYCKVTIHTLT